jgi:hypothetical protein
MAKMIEVTKKVYQGDNLVDEKFDVNADNIIKIETIDRDWSKSIIFMIDNSTIETVERKEEISQLINH